MDFLNQTENLLDMPLADKADVMRELTAHFDELCDELVASGMDAAEARTAAEQRMGTPSEIAAQMNAAHYTASWKSALLCVVPFAVSAMYSGCFGLGAGLRHQVRSADRYRSCDAVGQRA